MPLKSALLLPFILTNSCLVVVPSALAPADSRTSGLGWSWTRRQRGRSCAIFWFLSRSVQAEWWRRDDEIQIYFVHRKKILFSLARRQVEWQKRKHTDNPDTLREATCAVSKPWRPQSNLEGGSFIHLSPEGRSQIISGSWRDQVALGSSLAFLLWEAQEREMTIYNVLWTGFLYGVGKLGSPTLTALSRTEKWFFSF